VERKLRALSQQAVGLDHEEHVRVLDRDDDVLKSDLAADLDVPHGALKEGFRLGVAVLVQDVALKASGVDPDADGHALFLGGQQDFVLPLLLADVTGVYAHLGNTGIEGLERVVVVEVDVGYNGNGAAIHDILQRGGIFRAGHGHADNIGARIYQRLDFGEGFRDVVCFRRRHGLDGDRSAASDLDAAYVDSAAMPSWSLHGMAGCVCHPNPRGGRLVLCCAENLGSRSASRWSRRGQACWPGRAGKRGRGRQ